MSMNFEFAKTIASWQQPGDVSLICTVISPQTQWFIKYRGVDIIPVKTFDDFNAQKNGIMDLLYVDEFMALEQALLLKQQQNNTFAIVPVPVSNADKYTNVYRLDLVADRKGQYIQVKTLTSMYKTRLHYRDYVVFDGKTTTTYKYPGEVPMFFRHMVQFLFDEIRESEKLQTQKQQQQFLTWSSDGNARAQANPNAGGSAKTNNARWLPTQRKVSVKGARGKPAASKTVYRNSATGELRVRKMVARSNGSKRASYVKF